MKTSFYPEAVTYNLQGEVNQHFYNTKNVGFWILYLAAQKIYVCK